MPCTSLINLFVHHSWMTRSPSKVGDGVLSYIVLFHLWFLNNNLFLYFVVSTIGKLAIYLCFYKNLKKKVNCHSDFLNIGLYAAASKLMLEVHGSYQSKNDEATAVGEVESENLACLRNGLFKNVV